MHQNDAFDNTSVDDFGKCCLETPNFAQQSPLIACNQVIFLVFGERIRLFVDTSNRAHLPGVLASHPAAIKYPRCGEYFW